MMLTGARRAGGLLRLVLQVASRIVEPALFLWPWMVGNAAYGLFLNSEQGSAIALGFFDSPTPDFVIAAIVAGTQLLVTFATVLSLITADAHRAEVAASKKLLTLGLIVDGTWILTVATLPSIFFWIRTGANAALITAATVLTISAIFWLSLAFSGRNRDSLPRRTITVLHQQRHFLVVLTTITAISPIMAGALFTTTKPAQLSVIGPLLIVMLGFSALATLAGMLIIAIPLTLGFRWIGVLLLAGVITINILNSPIVDGENPLMPNAIPNQVGVNQNCKSPNDLESALSARAEPEGFSDANATDDRRLYLVSSEGGGIRAAYWTAITLAQLDANTDDDFGKTVAVVSGVSGGSLGIATWLAARERQDLSPESRLRLVSQFLESDFLSPLIGGFLFLDVPRLVFGPLWFKARRDHVFEKTMADRWKSVGGTDFFQRNYFNLCFGSFGGHPPAVFFNATDALTGSFVALSETGLIEKTSLEENLTFSTFKSASVAQAIHASARFPYLSPAAEIGINTGVIAKTNSIIELVQREESTDMSLEETQKEEDLLNRNSEKIMQLGIYSRLAVLVDGGYVDNTALTPTRQALSYIDEQRQEETRNPSMSQRFSETSVIILHISNDPGSLCLPPDPASSSDRVKAQLSLTKQVVHCNYDLERLDASLRAIPLQWLTTPVQTLLAVRSQKSAQTRMEVRDSLWKRRDELSRSLHPKRVDQWVDYSVERELVEAYAVPPVDPMGTPSIMSPEPRSEMLASNLHSLMVDEDFDRADARSKRAHGVISEQALIDYMRRLDRWHRAVLNGGSESKTCLSTRPPTFPPLGWKLNAANTKLLNCLGAIAVRRDFQHTKPPNLPSDAVSDIPVPRAVQNDY